MSDRRERFAACIPTKDRPLALRELLHNLLTQDRTFDTVLIVDASESDATQAACAELAPLFGEGVLLYERSESGVTLQRKHGIEVLRRSPDVGYIAFFDDDVILDDRFLSVIAGFMQCDEGRSFGAVSGFDNATWGRPFSRLDRLYHRLRLFDGELVPGRWLYCGRFLELEQLPASTTGIHDCSFVRGGFTVWRAEVFDEFNPPTDMGGYALGEDKHLSLRAGTRYRLAVHGDARAWHLHAPGGRPRRMNMAFKHVRMGAFLIRDCDPARSSTRYLAFLGFTLVDCAVQLVWRILKAQFRDLATVGASAAGLISCIVAPPRRSNDALDVGGGR